MPFSEICVVYIEYLICSLFLSSGAKFGDANGCGIILQLWQSNPKLVLQWFIDMMTIDECNIVTVINNSQELKVKLCVICFLTAV